jgi:hypothetical protein
MLTTPFGEKIECGSSGQVLDFHPVEEKIEALFWGNGEWGQAEA